MSDAPDLREVFDDDENNLVFEKNVTIPRKDEPPVRCNVYRPQHAGNRRFPVLVTYGPYGKDIHYSNFYPHSYAEVNPEHKSKYSVWETPDPVFWTRHGYVIVRADERGLGQSPGVLDTMSRGTSEAFFDVIEWASEQPWSSGKVGLLGISYYAGTQWRVAARRPKGLAAIIPWEGMSDYYRDRCRHGGILSNSFIKFWWDRQVVTNQYGRPGRAAAHWGQDTIEGDLSEAVLLANRRDQLEDNTINKFCDDEYYASKDFELEKIEVPLLSVANWGGILLHLRGNVEGFSRAGSAIKYLRFITGRHDLPFYYSEEVEIQKSFLDAFLKGDDPVGWSRPGEVPPVSVVLRKGNIGYNNPTAEATYQRREASGWPLPGTEYTKFHLTADGAIGSHPEDNASVISYKAMGTLQEPATVQFWTKPFETETEITGHITARLQVSVTPSSPVDSPKDIDLFLTLRHIAASGEEVFYTGTAGDPVPLTKGWLRVSHRKIDETNPRNRHYLPYRTYFSTDVQEVKADTIYGVDVEIWPSNVVVEPGARLVFEISSGDTQGCGIFQHNSEQDRPVDTFGGVNHVHLGPGLDNYVVLPIIAETE